VTDSPNKELNERFLLIVLVAATAIIVLYLFGVMLMQSILLVGNFSVFAGILTWEKYSRDAKISNNTRSIMEDKTDSRKPFDSGKAASARRSWAFHGRNAESNSIGQRWNFRESELNDQRVGRKDVPRPDLLQSSEDGSGKESNVRRLTVLQRRKHLEKLLAEARDIVSREPKSSQSIALIPIKNELLASYNLLKRSRSDYQKTLSDYWASWAVIHSVSKGVAIDATITHYVSGDYRKNFSLFIRYVESKKTEEPRIGKVTCSNDKS